MTFWSGIPSELAVDLPLANPRYSPGFVGAQIIYCSEKMTAAFIPARKADFYYKLVDTYASHRSRSIEFGDVKVIHDISFPNLVIVDLCGGLYLLATDGRYLSHMHIPNAHGEMCLGATTNDPDIIGRGVLKYGVQSIFDRCWTNHGYESDFESRFLNYALLHRKIPLATQDEIDGYFKTLETLPNLRTLDLRWAGTTGKRIALHR